MHSIVQFFGAIIVLLGAALIVFGIAALDRATYGSPGLVLIASGIGTIVAGAILYCFGAIVEHLIAIRRSNEAQLRIFGERLGGRQ